MDKHATAVVLRPVPPECPIVVPFKEAKGIIFDCAPRVFALAGANGVVTCASGGCVTLYCELPNMTVLMRYDNLRSLHVKKGQKIKETDTLGTPDEWLKLTITDLKTQEPVEPEFFSDYRIPS